jgi:phage regulator Rha-like protein
MTTSIIPNSSLEVSDLDGQLVIDSRLIAIRLGVQHESLVRTIEKHNDALSQFGILRFQIGKLEQGLRKQRQKLLGE